MFVGLHKNGYIVAKTAMRAVSVDRTDRHNGQGDRGGTVRPLGELNLPDEVVSSEFLTMNGSKFSTSRGTVTTQSSNQGSRGLRVP